MTAPSPAGQTPADRGEAVLRPFEELFAGGPDTTCRTTWRREPGWSLPGASAERTECVEVPMADLRDAFDRAAAAGRGSARRDTVSGPVCTCDEGRLNVCHDPRNEPHYAGCPRWGTRKVPVTGDAATELLREEIARELSDGITPDEMDYRAAERILALPSVRRLLAVEQRVRELADHYARSGAPALSAHDAWIFGLVAHDLNRALGGDDA